MRKKPHRNQLQIVVSGIEVSDDRMPVVIDRNRWNVHDSSPATNEITFSVM